MDEWINVSIKQGIEIEKRERPKEEKKEKDRRLSFDPHIRREEDYKREAHNPSPGSSPFRWLAHMAHIRSDTSGSIERM